MPAPRKTRRDIHVTPCSEEQDLRIVGSSKEIGGWNPQKGLRLIPRQNQCSVSILLEEYSVLRFKVVEAKGNEIQWGQGADQILWKQEDLSVPWKQ